MKLKTFFVLLSLGMFAQLSATAQPVVSNVRAAQRAGTQLVDIYYDLASASNALTVSIAVSTNGGASYTLPATSFTGAVGAGHCAGNKPEDYLERRGGLADQFLHQCPLPCHG
jgi:hypothetical protein